MKGGIGRWKCFVPATEWSMAAPAMKMPSSENSQEILAMPGEK